LRSTVQKDFYNTICHEATFLPHRRDAEVA